MQRRTALSAAGSTLLVGALTLTGCSSTSGKAAARTTAGETAVQRLQAVKKVVDAATGFHIELSSANVPSTASGLLSGSGDGSHAPAFKGALRVQIAGANASVPVVAIGNVVYAKLPFAKAYSTINPSTYGAPDPNVLFSSGPGGLSALLPITQGAAYGSQKRDGSETVQTITGTLPSSAVHKTLGFGKDSTGLNYNVEYEITSTNELRQVRVTGPFYTAGGTTSYLTRFTKYGEKVDVSKPS
ncbi:LppX_LprAFG lipoprotein [Allobranchiibius sp. GilTou73]|uniref:LppX_LprAFG lipoprotein n=1 Tax=Allobranchiibius sp. GilTou73 TaxID=2904523 RepID=UPI001F2DD05F|nr:LppX_LprAFG lipoprotein [Allobranchiibius sp. GilTou73]UIJ35872.1 LppX_LprAFG lipoprotein [Allobranchiibius sp. GilTou73]